VGVRFSSAKVILWAGIGGRGEKRSVVFDGLGIVTFPRVLGVIFPDAVFERVTADLARRSDLVDGAEAILYATILHRLKDPQMPILLPAGPASEALVKSLATLSGEERDALPSIIRARAYEATARSILQVDQAGVFSGALLIAQKQPLVYRDPAVRTASVALLGRADFPAAPVVNREQEGAQWIAACENLLITRNDPSLTARLRTQQDAYRAQSLSFAAYTAWLYGEVRFLPAVYQERLPRTAALAIFPLQHAFVEQKTSVRRPIYGAELSAIDKNCLLRLALSSTNRPETTIVPGARTQTQTQVQQNTPASRETGASLYRHFGATPSLRGPLQLLGQTLNAAQGDTHFFRTLEIIENDTLAVPAFVELQEDEQREEEETQHEELLLDAEGAEQANALAPAIASVIDLPLTHFAQHRRPVYPLLLQRGAYPISRPFTGHYLGFSNGQAVFFGVFRSTPDEPVAVFAPLMSFTNSATLIPGDAYNINPPVNALDNQPLTAVRDARYPSVAQFLGNIAPVRETNVNTQMLDAFLARERERTGGLLEQARLFALERENSNNRSTFLTLSDILQDMADQRDKGNVPLHLLARAQKQAARSGKRSFSSVIEYERLRALASDGERFVFPPRAMEFQKTRMDAGTLAFFGTCLYADMGVGLLVAETPSITNFLLFPIESSVRDIVPGAKLRLTYRVHDDMTRADIEKIERYELVENEQLKEMLVDNPLVVENHKTLTSPTVETQEAFRERCQKSDIIGALETIAKRLKNEVLSQALQYLDAENPAKRASTPNGFMRALTPVTIPNYAQALARLRMENQQSEQVVEHQDDLFFALRGTMIGRSMVLGEDTLHLLLDTAERPEIVQVPASTLERNGCDLRLLSIGSKVIARMGLVPMNRLAAYDGATISAQNKENALLLFSTRVDNHELACVHEFNYNRSMDQSATLYEEARLRRFLPEANVVDLSVYFNDVRAAAREAAGFLGSKARIAPPYLVPVYANTTNAFFAILPPASLSTEARAIIARISNIEISPKSLAELQKERKALRRQLRLDGVFASCKMALRVPMNAFSAAEKMQTFETLLERFHGERGATPGMFSSVLSLDASGIQAFAYEISGIVPMVANGMTRGFVVADFAQENKSDFAATYGRYNAVTEFIATHGKKAFDIFSYGNLIPLRQEDSEQFRSLLEHFSNPRQANITRKLAWKIDRATSQEYQLLAFDAQRVYFGGAYSGIDGERDARVVIAIAVDPTSEHLNVHFIPLETRHLDPEMVALLENITPRIHDVESLYSSSAIRETTRIVKEVEQVMELE